MDDQGDEARKDEAAEAEALEVLRAIANDPEAAATARVAAARAILAHVQEREARRRVAATNAAFGDLLPLT